MKPLLVLALSCAALCFGLDRLGYEHELRIDPVIYRPTIPINGVRILPGESLFDLIDRGNKMQEYEWIIAGLPKPNYAICYCDNAVFYVPHTVTILGRPK